MAGFDLTKLNNIHWFDAVYNIEWTGQGNQIKEVTLDGISVIKDNGQYMLTSKTGKHTIKIVLR